jgi:hypothetical protein
MSRCCVGVFVAVLAGGGVVLLHAGCGGGSCGAVGLVPSIITVSNATTGRLVCDAKVVASGPFLLGNGPDASANSATLSSEGRTCELEFATPSTFTLRVSAPGFRSATATGAGVTYASCPGVSVPPLGRLNVALTPN